MNRIRVNGTLYETTKEKSVKNRIRINGVLYEAVNSRTNHSNRALNESNSRVLTKKEMIGTPMAPLPYGPCYIYDNGAYTVTLAGDADDPDRPDGSVPTVIYLQPNDYFEKS